MKGWTKEMVRVTVETNYPFCNGVTKDEALQLAHDLLCELKQTRKETAEKFARLVEFHSVSTRDENGREIFTISALGLKEILHEEFGIPYNEIAKEFTEGNV